MNVRQHSSVGDGRASKQLGELFIIADSKLDVSRDDSRFLTPSNDNTGQKIGTISTYGTPSKTHTHALFFLNGATFAVCIYLVVSSSIASELKNFGCQVLKNRRQIHGCACSYSSRILALLEITSNTSDGKL